MIRRLFHRMQYHEFTKQTSEGKIYSWFYRPRSRRKSPRSELSIQTNKPFDFSIEPEGVSHRLAKTLGFAGEFQTHDITFNEKFYILSDDPQLCYLLNAESLRQSIKNLFAKGVASLVSEEGSLTAVMRDADPQPPLDIDALVNELHTINERMSKITLPANSPGKKMKTRAAYATGGLIAAGILSFFALAACYYTLLDTMALIRMAALISIPCVILLLLAIRQWFKGSSYGVDVFYTALIACIPAVGLNLYVGLYSLNVYLDHSKETVHRQLVTAKHSTRHKKSTSYYIVTNNWNKQGEPLSLKINYTEYSRANVGDRIFLYTHPGYLQVEWIKRFEVLSR